VPRAALVGVVQSRVEGYVLRSRDRCEGRELTLLRRIGGRIGRRVLLSNGEQAREVSSGFARNEERKKWMEHRSGHADLHAVNQLRWSNGLHSDVVYSELLSIGLPILLHRDDLTPI